MNLQDNDTMQLGSLIQQQILVHMARFDKSLAAAARVLTADNFPWSPGAVLAKVLLDYYAKYKSRPPFQILTTEVKTLLQSGGQDYIHELELPQLTQTLELIRSEPESGLSAQWSLDAIKKYYSQHKLADFTKDASMALQTGVGVDAVVSKAAALSTGLDDDANDAMSIASCLDTSDFVLGDPRMSKIATGLERMDKAIGGGLAPREMCLIIALQGAGKSNFMLNTLVSAAYDGNYNLFISLEMPKQTIQERVLAMTACIPAIKFRTDDGIHSMTDYERKRIADVQKTDLSRKLIVWDCSGVTCTIDNLVDYVGRWLKSLEKMGVRDQAGVVCIDYVNYIEVEGLAKDKTNLSPDVAKKIIDKLKKSIANAYGVRVYVAAQTTSKAEGAQVLNRSHVAWSFHANDAIDFGFGLAPKEDTRYAEVETDLGMGGPPAVDITVKGRQLVLSSFKARAGNTTAFPFYQAPTLRMYNKQSDYKNLESLIFAGEFKPGMEQTL